MIKKTLKLTIVIPAYNEEDYLADCLDSISSQTIMPDEVIVVDNNSSDKTVGIAKGYKFVKVVHEPRQGVVFTRNTGFNAAGGEIIGRIDADTFLAPDWVENAKKAYAASGLKHYAATAPPVFRNPGFQAIWYVLHRVTYFWPARFLIGHTTLIGSNMVITRGLWQEIRDSICCRSDIHEDMDLAWHAYRAGVKVDFQENLHASVLFRRMIQRFFLYPTMMIRIKTTH